MSEQEKQIPDGYMENAKGALVPIETIKPEHIVEDALVRDLMTAAETLNAQLAAFKQKAFGDVEAFRELISEKYGAKRGGKKGNVTLNSYDGSLQLVVAVNESISFGPELEAAKALIDECIQEWSKDANANLRALVDDAFQVDKQGKISTGRVLGLRRLNNEDAKWLKAMAAISDALRVTGSKSYFRAYKRQQGSEERNPVSLDIASV
ncbi:DUF3164 family protein [uncultured Cohaesibacter sp.]|uniref:DUF3164 family protein n=1 Tax=uncultured Cohaesibacter sp. TaxID=1002546 RepID=UPI0029C916B5|nr:DUF3164 family protein [uncultured Cohaesibacter sp.]